MISLPSDSVTYLIGVAVSGATSLLKAIIAIPVVPGVLLCVNELAKKYRAGDSTVESMTTTVIMLTA